MLDKGVGFRGWKVVAMRRLRHVSWLPPAAAVFLLLAAGAQAQFNFPFNSGLPANRFELSDSVYIDQADSATRTHLERVKAFVANQQWDEAVETLREIMEEHGEKLVHVDLRPAMRPYVGVDKGLRYELRHFLSLRDVCQMLISELPAQALKLYRDRVDPAARQLYEQAERGGSEAEPALRRIVEQFFVSSFGDQALLRLGDRALERGNEALARAYWQQLIPAAGWQQAAAPRPDSPRPPWLIYPDSDIPPAEIAARLVLLSIFEDARSGQRQLVQFHSKYPDAKGRLAGHDANYAQTLAALLEASAAWVAPSQSSDWLTFAGSPERTRVVPAKIDVGAVRWHQELPRTPGTDLSFSTRRIGEDNHQPLSYFPLVVGDVLLINSQYEIRAYNIHTGNPAWGSGKDPVIYRDEEFSAERRPIGAALGVPRFTMTACGNKLLARMGNPVTGSQSEQFGPSSLGYIICLDLAAEGKLLWRTSPPEERWSFEGSPLCDGARVYVGMRRSDVRPQSHVACLDARTGLPVWRRLVCSAETPAQGQRDEITHNLLCLHEGTLYYNTNLGAVASLDARSGHINWLTAYPRAKSGDLSQRATHFYRDLTPCIYDHGRLYVAPSDAPPVFALDAASGLLLWRSETSTDAPNQLLGVAGGHLWASGEKLWWFDSVSGNHRGQWPEQERPNPKSLGRGVLAADKVYWPTAHEIYQFDQRTGRQVRQPIELSQRGGPSLRLSGGNLLVSGGYLFIVTGEAIFAFDQHSGTRLADEKIGRHDRVDGTLAPGLPSPGMATDGGLVPAVP